MEVRWHYGLKMGSRREAEALLFHLITPFVKEVTLKGDIKTYVTPLSWKVDTLMERATSYLTHILL